MANLSLIMLAAGNSTRFDMGVKKQFLRLGDDPLWLYATRNLSTFYPFKKIVVTSSNTSYMKKFARNYEFVEGGATRAESLKKALEIIDSEFVMVSDVARVLVSKSLFDRLIENLDKADCITPALKSQIPRFLKMKPCKEKKSSSFKLLKFHALAYSNKP